MRTSSSVTSAVSSPETLRTADGIELAVTRTAARGPSDLVIVLVPGFSGWSRKPGVVRATAVFAEAADVVQVDLRGHGRSAGRSTLADREVLDVDAAVGYARGLGPRHVVTVGFSMGGAAVLRHAALVGEQLHGHPVQQQVDAVVSISVGSAWHILDTKPMRRLHWLVLTRLGRVVARRVFKVRVDPGGWGEAPMSPKDAVARMRVPLLIVHGDEDAYLKEEHGHLLHEAATGPVEFWLERGFGHAEEAADADLLRRIGAALPGLLSARDESLRDGADGSPGE